MNSKNVFPKEINLTKANNHTAEHSVFTRVISNAPGNGTVANQLQPGEIEYKTLIEQLPAITYIVTHGEVNRTTYISPQIEKFFSFSQEEWLADPQLWVKQIHPDDRERVLAEIKAQDFQREPFTSEYKMLNKAGQVFWVRNQTTMVLDEAGQPLYSHGVIFDITQQKRTEEKLLQTSSELQTVFQALPDLYFRLAADGTILGYYAHQVSDLYAPPEQFLGQKMQDVLPPNVGQKFADAFAQTLQTKSRVTVEYTLPLNGEPQIFEARLLPLLKEQIIAIVRNITGRKQMETAEREQRLLAESLRENAIALNSTLDLDQVLERILARVEQFTSYDVASIMLIEEADTAKVVHHRGYDNYGLTRFIETVSYSVADTPNLQQMVTHGRPLVIDNVQAYPGWITRPEEAWLTAYVGVPIYIRNQVIGFLQILSATPATYTPLHAERLQAFADQAAIAIKNARMYNELRRYATELEQRVAERERAETELRKLSSAVKHSGTAILIANLSGTIEFVNPSFTNMTGYTFDEVVGQTPRILKSGHHPPEFYKELWSTITGGNVWEGEFLNKKKDDTLYWEHATISPVKNKAGKTTHYVAVKEDITQRKRAEQELKKAKEQAEIATQAKSEFLANMSHEIRTPLNAIIGMTGLLLDTPLNTEQQDFAETARTSGDALLTIINDILDFSKIEAGKLELETQPFNLRDCVETSLELVAPQAAEKGLELIYHIDNNTPLSLVGDVTRLRQILINLLTNAVKFTETGEVVVSVEARPLSRPTCCNVHFAVTDTGIGIAPNRLDRLFKSFSQVDASTTRRYGGTGLGLAISNRLVEMMNGTMWVESEPGRGSTFHFTIQADKTDAQPSPPENLEALAGKHLLIVDDNTAHRLILGNQLENWGMTVQAAASGAQALEWIEQGDTFDAVILDMHMPDMDGTTLAKAIREARGPDLPLLLLTSMGGSEEDEQRDAAGFAACLYKPVKQADLHHTLLNLFGQQVNKDKLGPEPTELDPELGKRHPLRILLAEDNMINQKVALKILERLGYRADAVGNGVEVLEALRRQPYDVVLMDVQMPEMDGLETTQHIRQKWSNGAGPQIVAMTANARQEDRDTCLATGMNDYISKPVRVDELVKVLRNCKPLAHPASSPSPNGSTHQPNVPSLDPSILENFLAAVDGGDRAIISELVNIFLKDAPRLLSQMQQSFTEQDFDTTHRAAHTLKSSAANMGVMKLSSMSKEIEMMCRANQINNISQKIAQATAEFEHIKKIMETDKQIWAIPQIA